MTIIYREGPEGSTDDLLEEAQATFRRANLMMRRFCDDFEDGKIRDMEQFKLVYKSFKDNLPNAIKERERLASQLAQSRGIAGDKPYGLDFDAARQEIGRRLACLAAAGDAGGVSE